LVAVTWCGAVSFAHAGDQVAKRFRWDRRPAKCFAPDAVPSAPICAEAANWPDWSETESRVQSLFTEPDFDLVARAERELAESTERFPNGEYRFDAWYWALNLMFKKQPDRYAETLEKWKVVADNKGQVLLAQVLLLEGEAWAARGGGYSNTVSPEARRIYEAKMGEADALIDSAPAALKKTGAWHAIKVGLAMERGDQRGAKSTAFRKAATAWPEYGRIYKTAINLSLPQWGGNFDDVEAVVRYAYDKTKATAGATWYATLYTDMFIANPRYTLKDTRADWTLMRKGFFDALDKPGTDGRLFSFAGMACQMRDREVAKRLYGVIDQLPEAKRPKMATDPCRVFANGGEPKGI
jgi:hypothetical protein